MLRIEGSPDCEVIIDNVNVTYSQYLDYNLLRYTTWNDDSVITINSENTLLTLNDVVVTAEISCSAAPLDGWLTYISNPALPYCNSPVPFLINQVCSR